MVKSDRFVGVRYRSIDFRLWIDGVVERCNVRDKNISQNLLKFIDLD